MTAEKDVQVARKKGRGGGGGVIRAMPERKHSFLKVVFPNSVLWTSCIVIFIRDVSIAQRRLTQALDRKTLSSEVVSLAGCLATVPRS